MPWGLHACHAADAGSSPASALRCSSRVRAAMSPNPFVAMSIQANESLTNSARQSTRRPDAPEPLSPRRRGVGERRRLAASLHRFPDPLSLERSGEQSSQPACDADQKSEIRNTIHFVSANALGTTLNQRSRVRLPPGLARSSAVRALACLQSTLSPKRSTPSNRPNAAGTTFQTVTSPHPTCRAVRFID